MHLRFDAAPAVVSAPSSPHGAAQISLRQTRRLGPPVARQGIAQQCPRGVRAHSTYQPTGDACIIERGPSPSALIPLLSIRRCSGPLEPRYEMFTASGFWRRDSVLKSGTAQSKPIRRKGLSTNPVVYLNAMPNSTFMERHVWMATLL